MSDRGIDLSWRLVIDNGATEGGSSGGPYFDQNKRIIAQHYGIDDGLSPVCDRKNKYGGRFDQSWTGSGNNATRLSNWLDPTNTGATTTNTTGVGSLWPSIYTISGPDVFCTTGNYSVSGTPPGSVVTWSGSGAITVNSTTGVATRSYVGPGIVQANINICGRTITATKNVHAGVPIGGWIFTETYYVGSGAGKVLNPMGYTTLGALYKVGTYTMVPGSVLEYEWKITDHSNWGVTGNDAAYSNVQFEYWNSPTSTSQKISIRGRNTCGWGSYDETTWTFSSFFAKYSVSPNPASEQVSLLFEDLVSAGGLPDDIKLFHESSTKAVRELKVTESHFKAVKNNNNKLSIDVRDLPRLTYYLHVNYNNKKESDTHRVLLK